MATLKIEIPRWVSSIVARRPQYDSDVERVSLAIELARENVRRRSGGPFGAVVVERGSGRVIGAGVNLVVPLRSSIMHAEIAAIVSAQSVVGRHTLRGPDDDEYELATSCEPCAMCLGASLWSGVRRLVFGALREDALALGFEEGPVFPESYDYLRARGVEAEGGVCREEAAAVLAEYARNGLPIYNP